MLQRRHTNVSEHDSVGILSCALNGCCCLAGFSDAVALARSNVHQSSGKF